MTEKSVAIDIDPKVLDRRDRHYYALEYTCEDCKITIQGHTGDPQESPWLYCPKCGKEMDLAVDKP